MKEPITAIFIGPQGSGKGTQIKLLKDFLEKRDGKSSVFELDTGAGFRELVKGEGYTPDLVRDSLNGGEIQPDFLTVFLFSRAMIDGLQEDMHAIFDSTTRTVLQTEVFNTAMKFYGRSPYILVLDVPREISIERLVGRGRTDDTKEGIEQRLGWYETEVKPVIDWYREHPNYSVVDVDGSRTISEIHEDILSKLELK